MIAAVDTSRYVLDIGLVLLLAAAFGFIARRLGLPAVIGYLVVGVLVSPFTPGYVAGREQVALFADIGVVLLLFEVGIEIDLRRVRNEDRSILLLAPAQVLLTTALSTLALAALGISWFGSAILGIGIAMSSSVVVVNITRSRRRTTNPGTDDALLRWSVLQDIAGVVMAAVVIAVGGAAQHGALWSLLGLVVFSVVAYLAARALPRLLQFVRWEQDLFLIISVASGLSIAAIGSVIFDMPMALAAFVAGLALNHRGDIAEVRRLLLPFRDLFAVLFFVVIGSLVQPAQLVDALPWVGIYIGLLVVGKTLVIAAFARFGRISARPAQLAVGLSQMGEFSYVLGALALSRGALTQAQFAATLVVVMLSIAATTVGVRVVGARH